MALKKADTTTCLRIVKQAMQTNVDASIRYSAKEEE
jgi:hypothetical protein